MGSIFIPQVFTVTDGHEHAMDLESYQFVKERKLKIIGEIDSAMAGRLIDQMDYLDARGDEDIQIMINSPGGSVSDGLMIYDTIKRVHCDVSTIASGLAASMGAILLAAGTPGKRFATPNTWIMIHQPMGGVQGQATDISRAADHIQHVKKRLARILSQECHKTEDEMLSDMERDHWLTGAEALDYGIIDKMY